MAIDDECMSANVLYDITLDEFLQYGELYEHKYNVMPDCIGKINFRSMTVYYNPLFNEDGITFCHEMVHHYYNQGFATEHIPEHIVEQQAQDIYKIYNDIIDDYVYSLINEK